MDDIDSVKIISLCILCVQQYQRYAIYWRISVHQGVFSTPGGVQYTGAISSSTSADILSTPDGYHKYTGGVRIYVGYTMSR